MTLTEMRNTLAALIRVQYPALRAIVRDGVIHSSNQKENEKADNNLLIYGYFISQCPLFIINQTLTYNQQITLDIDIKPMGNYKTITMPFNTIIRHIYNDFTCNTLKDYIYKKAKKKEQ